MSLPFLLIAWFLFVSAGVGFIAASERIWSKPAPARPVASRAPQVRSEAPVSAGLAPHTA